MGTDLIISDKKLTFADIKPTLLGNIKINITAGVKHKIIESCNFVKAFLQQGKPVYGVNTGFGKLANIAIKPDEVELLQKNLILSHAVGVGEQLPAAVVRLMLLLKVKSLSQGFSGISLETLEALIKLLNADVLPLIPKKGSVGASGDLAPLAHMSAVLLGYGMATINENVVTATAALNYLNVQPLKLQAKEGLALLNGTQASTAIALYALHRCKILFEAALIAGALSVDAAHGSDNPFDAKIQQIRGLAGQIEVAALLRKLLHGSEIREAHRDCAKVQDPYSLRCQPQVMGACLEQINFVENILLNEANAVTDNPLVFAKEKQILTGGNFHAEPVAFAADNLALAICEIGSMSERRIALLIDNNLSNLPAFLIKNSGINSGFMIAQVTAAALVSENKQLATPASVDSIPTSANQEDHVSMATNGANRLYTMLDNLSYILAIELLAAAQGIDFAKPKKTSPLLQQIMQLIRAKAPLVEQDRYLHDDIAAIKDLVISGAITVGQ